MKELKFTQLKITNFRNINELEINFNDNFTEISGRNGLGKTNTLSAILWCLFGKNIYDEKLFTISPIIDGIEDNSINTIVKLIINNEYVIERSYKDRKTNLKTGWIIDGKEELVSLTQSKYNEELKEHFVDEETFKSLSNINYIPSLNWKDLKKLIFELIGNIEDDEVLIRENFELIEEYVRKFGIEETQKLLKETETNLNDDIKRLETQYQTLLNTKEKYVANEEENKELLSRKDEIEKQLYYNKEQSEKQQEYFNEYNAVEKAIKGVEYEIEALKVQQEFLEKTIEEYDNLYKNFAFDVELQREKDIKSKEKEINDVKCMIQDFNNEINSNNVRLEQIKQQGEELKLKEIKVENDTCSACGQKLPQEKIDNTLDNLKKERDNKLLSLKEEYDKIKKDNLCLEENIKLRNEQLIIFNEELENIKIKVYEVVEETDKQKEIKAKKELKKQELIKKDEEMVDLDKQYSALVEKIQTMYKPFVENYDSTSLKQELNAINEKLATTTTLNKISEDIELISNDLESARANKLSNKNKLLEVVKFNNVKADLLQQRVRQYFNLVNFRTKEFNQNGEEVETFKIVDDKNVEFKEINTGNKILLGIDLIKGIQKAKGLNIPIIIDNFESLTTDIDNTENQIIVARAMKNINELEIK